MENSFIKKIVPAGIKGKDTDVEHSVTLNNVEEARDAFKRAYKRMLNVNIWHNLSGFASAHFALKDEEGEDMERLAQVGDHFQIDIPGPGPASGDGYDWVKVEAIEDDSQPGADEENYGMRVRSCTNPNTEGGDTSHFFTSEATSSFIINRQKNKVTSSYHGRNEVINTDTEKVQDKIRNTIIATGALAGISEIQWGRLIESFLEEEV